MKLLRELFKSLAVASRLMIATTEANQGLRFYDADGREITDMVAELERLEEELTNLKREFMHYRFIVNARVMGWDNVNLESNLGRLFKDVYMTGGAR